MPALVGPISTHISYPFFHESNASQNSKAIYNIINNRIQYNTTLDRKVTIKPAESCKLTL